MILLKSPKALFLANFWTFLPDGDFFQKTQFKCVTQLYMGH